MREIMICGAKAGALALIAHNAEQFCTIHIAFFLLFVLYYVELSKNTSW